MIKCNHCGASSAAPEQAQTSNGKPGVCPECYSEDWRYTGVSSMDQMLENALAEIRRATKVREFVLGGIAR